MPMLFVLLICTSTETADPKPRMWRPLQIYVGNVPPQKQDDDPRQNDDLKQNPMALSSL